MRVALGNPAQWEFMQTGTDDVHMLYATPLEPGQIASLATTTSFAIGRDMVASLAVYDETGSLVQ